MRRTIPWIGLAGILGLAVGSSAAEMRTDEIDSKILGRTVKLNVLLPDGYDREPDARWPAIYLLHGVGGDYTEWARVGIAEEAAGLPVILAMPEGDRSFYVNFHEDPKGRWDDYIVEEVVKHVDARYRTIPAREKRGVSGLSMGGYGAMMLGLRHPDLFASIASHSGALSGPTTKAGGEIGELLAKVFGPEGSATREAYDLVRLIRDLPEAKRPHIYIDCGAQDFLLDANRAYVAELAKLKVPYEYREVPGGHTFAYWKANVRYSLSRQLEAFGKEAPPANDLIGEWELVIDFGGQSADYTLRIGGTPEALSAVLVSPRSGEHKFKSISFAEGVLHMEIDRTYSGTALTLVYEGKPSAEGLAGKVTAKGYEGLAGEWTAKRKETKREEAP